MEQLDLDLEAQKPSVPDSVTFYLCLTAPDGRVDRHTLRLPEVMALRNDLNEWLDFVGGKQNGR